MMLSIAKMVSIQNRLLNGTDVKMEVLGGGETCRSATLSTTDPTWTGLG